MKENIQRSAFLNMVSGGVDYVTRLLVNFFLNPIMITCLGTTFFGVWQVIGQLNSYMATADIRSATSLKWIISRNRSTKSEDELKGIISAALYANVFFFPIYLILGVIITWFSPILSGVDKSYYFLVRVTTSLLVISFLVTQFFFLFESVLQGMNLAYKRLGVRSLIIIGGGVLTAWFLYLDYGLIGLAVVKIIISLITGISFWVILKQALPWFEFVKVKREEVMAFIKISGWFMFMKIADMLNQSIDMILIGYFAGPKYVSAYAVSKFSMMALAGVIRTISTSASIGLGRYIGEKEYNKILQARSQLLNLQWLLLISGGSVICFVNSSFVYIWTNENLFLGQIETFLIVIGGVLGIVQQIDNSIISFTLDVKNKIYTTVITAIMIIIMSTFLIPMFNVVGYLVAMVIGNIFMTFYNSFLVSKIVHSKKVYKDLFFSKLVILGLLCFCLLTYFGEYTFLKSWFSLAIVSLSVAMTLFFLLWLLGIDKLDKKQIINQIKRIKK